MQLGFDPLDDEAREKIWAMNFSRLRNAAVNLEYDYDAKEYVRKNQEVKELKLNGREIRNGECEVNEREVRF